MASIEEGVAFCLFVCRERKEHNVVGRRKDNACRILRADGNFTY
jgi:hypothetical protein